MNRHDARILIMHMLYRHLLMNEPLNAITNENEEPLPERDFINAIIDDIIVNEETYIKQIEALLNRWTFDRLNYVDQAVLIAACSELHLQLNDRPIIINEALQISKRFGDPDNYRYINGILDKI